ncbi:hypothetical protein IQ266_00920 [filamentous cyanobacterium LEGE 11480]|uniref:Uncharacterized protein n=1 Tax=Romeriopsis navalis LEGE 11480 TaxID=2777977 RepID=A0A928VII7_9CYAN|nr:hypothetical protein [Romeriopsis navalis]MBE9028317.1 hypothetical protein [Romeriopsis navalis LEGE 11480]
MNSRNFHNKHLRAQVADPDRIAHGSNSHQNGNHPAFLGNLLVGLATPPMILAVIGSHTVTQSISAISQLSEDLLRGDRLPVLHFPTPPGSN